MKYVVLTPLVLNGKTAKVDAQVELDAQDAADLLACGAVREMDKASDDGQSKSGKK